MKKLFRSPAFPLILAVACAHFAVDCMISIFPAYKTMVGIDLGIAGLLAGSCVFFAEGLQVFFGKWIDKGYQKIILLSGVIATVSASLFPYTEQLSIVGLLLLATYVGSACFHPAAASVLGGIQGVNKGLAMGIFATFGMAGMSIGQLAFTWIAEYTDGQTALLGLLSFTIAIVLFTMKLGDSPTHHPHRELSFSLFVKFFKSKPLRSLYFVQLASQTLIWATVFILPDVLKQRGYSENIVFGGGHFFFILGAAISSIPAGIISASITPQKTIAFSFLGCFAFLAQILIFTEAPVPLLLTNLFLFGACLGAIPPLVLAVGNELVPHNRGMVSVFLMGLVWIVSETLGIGGTGVIADLFEEGGPQYSFLILAATGAITGGGYALWLLRTKTEDLVFEPIDSQ